MAGATASIKCMHTIRAQIFHYLLTFLLHLLDFPLQAEQWWPPTMAGATASIDCLDPTADGSQERACDADGKWGAETSECKPKLGCNADVSSGFGGAAVNTVLAVPCTQAGFLGDRRRQCTSDGWQAVTDSCHPTGPCDDAAKKRCAGMNVVVCGSGSQCGVGSASALVTFIRVFCARKSHHQCATSHTTPIIIIIGIIIIIMIISRSTCIFTHRSPAALQASVASRRRPTWVRV
jgi:hypothetical protein